MTTELTRPHSASNCMSPQLRSNELASSGMQVVYLPRMDSVSVKTALTSNLVLVSP